MLRIVEVGEKFNVWTYDNSFVPQQITIQYAGGLEYYFIHVLSNKILMHMDLINRYDMKVSINRNVWFKKQDMIDSLIGPREVELAKLEKELQQLRKYDEKSVLYKSSHGSRLEEIGERS